MQYLKDYSQTQQMIYVKTPSFYKKSFVVFDCNCPFTVEFPLFSMMYRKFLQHSYVEEISKTITQIIVTSCVVQNTFIFPSVFFTIFILIDLLKFQVASDCCRFHEVSVQISKAINIYLSAYLFSVTNLNLINKPQNGETI
jgi:hypothetical protein